MISFAQQQADNDGLTCFDCRARHDEADTDPECDETDQPCHLMQVELLHENTTAWNLFWDMRHYGEGILSIHDLGLTQVEASDLLVKLRALQDTIMEIEHRRQKEEMDRMRRESKR